MPDQHAPMRLVLGRHGQVAHALIAQLTERFGAAQVKSSTQAELDFTQGDFEEKLNRLLDVSSPQIVYNMVAYTDVAQAEKSPQIAMQVNAHAVEILAKTLARRAITLVHGSTDYVFSGTAHAPYTEDAAPRPLNAYGASKLAGEEAVQRHHPDAYILRYSWVYDASRRNFLTTMAGLMQTQRRLRVVADQLGAPSFAGDLARITADFGDLLFEKSPEKRPKAGLYHACAKGYSSWHGFACHIRARLLQHGLPCVTQGIDPITAQEFSTHIRRPANSKLSTRKLEQLGIRLPHWQEGLDRAFTHMQQNAQIAEKTNEKGEHLCK